MRNFASFFNNFLRFCKLFSSGLLNKRGNVIRPGSAPLFGRISSKLVAMLLLQFDNFRKGNPIGRSKASV